MDLKKIKRKLKNKLIYDVIQIILYIYLTTNIKNMSTWYFDKKIGEKNKKLMYENNKLMEEIC